MSLRLWKEDDPILDMSSDGTWLWFDIDKNAKTYLFCLALLVLFTVVSKNLIRSRTGRALQAIRDRDVAAEVMGIPESKYKLIAFAGSLVLRRHRRGAVRVVRRQAATRDVRPHPLGRVHRDPPDRRCRHHRRHAASARFFVVLSPRFVEEFAGWAGGQAEGDGVWGGLWDSVVSRGAGDGGLISTGDIAPGFALPVNRLDELIYGSLVVLFLLFEPLGLYGIWVKIRNYWKGWPFSY